MVSDTPPERCELAIVIPHYNDVDRLRRCLAALFANPDDVKERCEVIVVDNGSAQSLDGLRAEFPSVRFLDQPERGAGPARNAGVASSTAPRIAFIDADCVAGPRWVTRALEFAPPEDPELGRSVVGGYVGTFDETPPPRSGAEAFEAVFAFDFKSYIEKKGFTGAGNMLTSRRVFDVTGPFRAELSEDVEWSRRAVECGARLIYDPELRVSHPTRQNWDDLRRKWLRMTEESFLLWLDRGKGRGTWALRGVAVLGSVPFSAVTVLASPDLASGRERARAIATLARLRATRFYWVMRQVAGLKLR